MDDDRDWAPPTSWAAWPVRESLLPQDDFAKGPQDDDDVFTFRSQATEPPSGQLEEMLSATVLRLAKDKFLARRLTETEGTGGHQEQEQYVKYESGPGQAPKGEGHGQGISEQEDHAVTAMDVDDFVPTVSTADDVSYELLRPAVRHILGQLDQTLMVLHRARVAGAACLSDSSATNAPDDDDDDGEHSSVRGGGHGNSSSDSDAGNDTSSRPGRHDRWRGRSRKGRLSSGADSPSPRRGRARARQTRTPAPFGGDWR